MRAILFDLDGTLLPMDQREFVEAYFSELVAKFSALGFDGKRLIDTVWRGTRAMAVNDGSETSREVFWRVFEREYGPGSSSWDERFLEFYGQEFNRAARVATPDDAARGCVAAAHEKGYMVALATSPIFPEVATRARLSWAGLKWEDFDLITTYENSRYCKPNPLYYAEIAGKLGVAPSDMMMAGNDVDEDIIAAAGLARTYLVEPYVLNSSGSDISHVERGTLSDLLSLIRHLPHAG